MLPRAQRAAAICDVDLDPPQQTALQQKINQWGCTNYRKLSAVRDSRAPLSDELLNQRADSFGYWLAHPFHGGVESRAIEFAKSNALRRNLYEEAMRTERRWRESRPPKSRAIYPV